MAERTPLYMDINNVYSGDEMGLPNRDFISEGIVGAGDMAVSAGAGNTVNIAAGACWVVGDTDVVNQPTYRIINDAVVNLGINPDPTNPRIVRIGMQMNDAGFSGVLRNGVLTAIHGTPAVGPVAPAEPASFLTLATVLVPAAAASSAAYTFTDLRTRAKVGGGSAAIAASPGYLAAPVKYTTLIDVVNTIAETDVLQAAGYTIPANTLGPNGLARVYLAGDLLNNSGGGVNITPRVYFGGAKVWDVGTFAMPNSASRQAIVIMLTVSNLGVTNAQLISGFTDWPVVTAGATTGFSMSTSAGGRYQIGANTAVDTTAGALLRVTVQWAAANALTSFRIRHSLIEFI